MKIIVVGCGRMGSGLAKKLVKDGHQVSVIDNKEEVLEKLVQKVDILPVFGEGFDKEVLEAANILNADALVSCTSCDETNALVARIAKNIYKVPRVVARLFNPEKAKIYSTLGIETISTTDWGINHASEYINYSELDAIVSLGSSDVELVKIEIPALLTGKIVDQINVVGVIRVVSIYRDNKAFIPAGGTVLESRDILYIAVLSTGIKNLKKIFGMD